MSDKKVVLAATLVALTVFGAPLAASANPVHATNPSSGISIHTDDGEDTSSSDGDDDRDDEHHGSIPPVFVTPTPTTTKPHTNPKHKPSASSSTTSGSTVSSDPASIAPAPTDGVTPVGPDGVAPADGGIATENSPGIGKPEEGRAVDITRVPQRQKSPADEFMDAAYIGLGALAISALGLGVTAAVRAVRIRRSGKSDYMYTNK